MSTNTNANTRFFNLHTEGLGYLDSMREVAPKAGQDFPPFFTATFCALEGDPKNPEKVYISLTIPSAQVIELLKPCMDQINNPGVKVFVNLRLAQLRAEPFMYGQDSSKPGQMGVNYSAKLINVLYLKVGDYVMPITSGNDKPTRNRGDEQKGNTMGDKPAVVKLSKDDPDFESKKDQLKKSGYRWSKEAFAWVLPGADQTGDQSGAPEAKSNKAVKGAASSSLFEVPPVVTLSKDVPDFEARKEALKSNGYRWNSELFAWVMPAVKLTKDEAQFEAKSEELKQAGYRWDSQFSEWKMAFQSAQNLAKGKQNMGGRRAYAR